MCNLLTKDLLLIMRYLLLLILSLIVSACGDYDELHSAPILMSRAEVESSIKMEAPRSLKSIGATALHKQALYIVEHYQGIHVFDNSNSSVPVKIGFIRVPGIWHIAMIGGQLVSDNSRDILSFNLADPLHPVLQARAKDLLMPPPSKYDPYYWGNSPDTMIVGYRDTVIRMTGGMR